MYHFSTKTALQNIQLLLSAQC